ncbi:hypothetical protein HZI73_11045 [Vallitalea pronyensis]|uniref:Uncharacterized protein n=1 Tax=Vallitalea pronyensis TaxID=1348613 RepID=A0A8J8MJH3_9FIRM|nr:hypothetical protein [Vallitalea pronyensis]QUI22790.1 hypothetical protein HZI73_11045 [Vallitalea pronyensis]
MIKTILYLLVYAIGTYVAWKKRNEFFLTKYMLYYFAISMVGKLLNLLQDIIMYPTISDDIFISRVVSIMGMIATICHVVSYVFLAVGIKKYVTKNNG